MDNLYNHTVEQWLDVITFFDAKNSLANFCFNHPSYVFPEIVKDSSIINSQKLGHPLLNSKNRIDNDFEINKNSFLIVTGANMAGKYLFTNHLIVYCYGQYRTTCLCKFVQIQTKINYQHANRFFGRK